MFQGFGLDPNKKVKQNLEPIFKFKKEKADKYDAFDKVLTKVGLRGYYLSKVHALSGGEEQRVAMAKIILKDSEIVFADEPTCNLDLDNKIKVYEFLKELNEQGKTIVVVSRDDKIQEYATKTVLL